MKIEIQGSGALGRYLAQSLSANNSVRLLSLRSSLFTQEFFSSDQTSAINSVNLGCTFTGLPDLTIYASQLSTLSLSTLRQSTLIISNGCAFLPTSSRFSIGSVSFLACQLRKSLVSTKTLYSYPVGTNIPTLSCVANTSLTSSVGLIIASTTPEQVIDKSLRTVFYMSLVTLSQKSFEEARHNTEIVQTCLDILSQHSSDPAHFISSTTSILANMSYDYTPTIARKGLHYEAERESLNFLYQKWLDAKR